MEENEVSNRDKIKTVYSVMHSWNAVYYVNVLFPHSHLQFVNGLPSLTFFWARGISYIVNSAYHHKIQNKEKFKQYSPGWCFPDLTKPKSNTATYQSNECGQVTTAFWGHIMHSFFKTKLWFHLTIKLVRSLMRHLRTLFQM